MIWLSAVTLRPASHSPEKHDAGFKALTGTPGYRLLLTGLLCDILAHMKVFWPGVVFSKAAFRDGACRRLRSRRMAAGNAVGGHRTLLNRQSFCAGLLKGIRNARGREIALDCARSASTRFTPFENRRSISCHLQARLGWVSSRSARPVSLMQSKWLRPMTCPMRSPLSGKARNLARNYLTTQMSAWPGARSHRGPCTSATHTLV